MKKQTHATAECACPLQQSSNMSLETRCIVPLHHLSIVSYLHASSPSFLPFLSSQLLSLPFPPPFPFHHIIPAFILSLFPFLFPFPSSLFIPLPTFPSLFLFLFLPPIPSLLSSSLVQFDLENMSRCLTSSPPSLSLFSLPPHLRFFLRVPFVRLSRLSVFLPPSGWCVPEGAREGQGGASSLLFSP